MDDGFHFHTTASWYHMENIILYTSSYLCHFLIWICVAYKFSPESLPRNRRTQTSLKSWYISPHCTLYRVSQIFPSYRGRSRRGSRPGAGRPRCCAPWRTCRASTGTASGLKVETLELSTGPRGIETFREVPLAALLKVETWTAASIIHQSKCRTGTWVSGQHRVSCHLEDTSLNVLNRGLFSHEKLRKTNVSSSIIWLFLPWPLSWETLSDEIIWVFSCILDRTVPSPVGIL